MTSSNLLSRVSLSSPSALSSAQVQVDGLVGGFVSQATDWRSLAAMAAGGVAYRLGRVGILSSGAEVTFPRQIAAIATGLSAEVSTFELTHRSLHSLGGEESSHRWRWSGQGGLQQGLLHSLVSFGALRGTGVLVEGQNLAVQHFLQDAGLVGAQNLTHRLGLSEAPRGSLISQFVEAETVNLQMQAGMALSHGLTGGRILGLERTLDLSALPRLSQGPVGEEVVLEGPRRPTSHAEPGDSIPYAAFSIHPGFILAPKLLVALGLGWALSNLRTRPAIATLVGIGALLAAKNYALGGGALEWGSDAAMFGLAAGYGFFRARSLAKDLEKNPFHSEPDMNFPTAGEPPAHLLSEGPINMKGGGTYLKTLSGGSSAPVEKDGFPRSFIWSINPTSGLSVRQKRFYFIFDPIRFSLSMGRLSRSAISRLIIPTLARRLDVDLSRFVNAQGESHFATFDQFFTRRFKHVPNFYPGAAPCEGSVIYMARSNSLEQVLQIKGETVNLRELLGPAAANRFTKVAQVGVIITYLSPRDYHLGHSPVEGKVVSLRRIPGKAWTVMPQIWNEPDVEGRKGSHYLNFNARDVVLKETEFGPFAAVYVAATNVFSTEIHPKIGDTVKAGMHEQSYHFGSTNVYVFDATRFYFPQSLKPGQQLTFGKTPFLIPRTDTPAESRKPPPSSIEALRRSQRSMGVTLPKPVDSHGTRAPNAGSSGSKPPDTSKGPKDPKK